MDASASWDGATWSPRPGLPGSAAVFKALSCVTASFCVAVGDRAVQMHGVKAAIWTLVAIWSGKRWSIVASPSPGLRPSPGMYPFDTLNGVSCLSSRFCVAVGNYTAPPRIHGPTNSLVEMWDGARWSVVPSPDEGPPGAFNTLEAVSCASPSSCMAVGTYEYSTGTDMVSTLVERWDGEAWSVMTSPGRGPSPSGDFTNALLSVSCPFSAHCVAVGSYEPGSGATEKGLVVVWSGSSWTLEPTAMHPQVVLGAVSCAATGDCVVLGSGVIEEGRL
ncbi:MAG TPA: hypothetical protein VK425_10285, partial [Acidimicrobiales bacterium]|nr:hypothetical protein [Acidimicrobiales bacterium]